MQHIEWDYESKNLFLGGYQDEILVWTIDIDNEVYEKGDDLHGHKNYIKSMYLAQESKILFSGDGAFTLKIWKKNAQGKYFLAQNIHEQGQQISFSFAFNEKTKRLFSGNIIGQIETYKFNEKSQKFEKDTILKGHTKDYINALLYVPE